MGNTGVGGVVTFLFVDQVGSTAQLDDLGDDAAAPVRAEMFSIIRAALAEHGGDEVDNTGDGIMATFASPVDAVDAAEAMQQGVHGHNARHPEAEHLRLRIGLHVGDAVVDQEGRHFGMPVVVAARLCAAAGADEVLVSDTIVALVASRRRHDFADPDELDLKGVGEPVLAHRLTWAPAPQPEAAALPGVLAGDPRFPFVGRDAEREALVDDWRRADEDGARRVVLVSGEPGVGKTRLAGEVARAALAAGGLVLFGRCDEHLAVPFRPVAEALRHYLDQLDDGDLAGRLGAHPGELARLLPDIATRWPGLPPPIDSDPGTEQYRMFDAVASWLAAASAERAAVLVLDDLHWAGHPTLLLVRHLIRSPDPIRMLLVGTYRDTDLDRSHPLADVLGDLRREPVVRRMALQGLDAAGVASFLEAAGGQDLDDRGEALADAIAAETAGNPFFVGEVLNHLVESGALFVEAGRWTADRPLADMGIPEGIRDVVSRRLSRLSGAANEVLARASVIGQAFELPVLIAVCDLDEDAVVDAVEEAVAVGLVQESEQVLGYRFAHALVRATLAEELPTLRRVRLHGEIGRALEAELGPRVEDRVAELAHHFAEAAPAGGVDKAVAYASEAGRLSEAAAAPHDAVDWFAKALDLHDAAHGASDSADRVELLIDVGRAQLAAGRSAYRETLLEAGSSAGRLGEVGLMVAAALANNRGYFSEFGRMDGDRVAAIEAALDAVGPGDSAERVGLLANLAMELTFAEPPEARQRLVDEATAMARRVDDPAARFRALMVEWVTIRDPQKADERADGATEMLALADAANDPAARLNARLGAAHSALERADGAAFRRVVGELEELDAELNQPMYSWLVAAHRATLHLVDGHLDEAAVALEAALAYGIEAGQPEAVPAYQGALTLILTRQGRGGEIIDRLLVPVVGEGWEDDPAQTLAPLAAAGGGWPQIGGYLISMFVQLDRPDIASTLYDHAGLQVDDVLRTAMPWPASLVAWSTGAIALDRRTDIAALYDALAPVAGHFAANWSMALGSVDATLGNLASALGRHRRADEHFEAAQAINRRLDSPTFLAEGLADWGRAMLAAGHPDRALSLLEQASDLAASYGLERTRRLADEASTGLP